MSRACPCTCACAAAPPVGPLLRVDDAYEAIDFGIRLRPKSRFRTWRWLELGDRGEPSWSQGLGARLAGSSRFDCGRHPRRIPLCKEICWVFPELDYWPLQQGKEPKWERTYNLLWQKAALRAARALHHDIGFDLRPSSYLGRGASADISRIAWSAADYRPDRGRRNLADVPTGPLAL